MTAPDTLDALVAEIWGTEAVAERRQVSPELRTAQNQALSAAIKAYLQSYLDDAADAP